jgi:hypothetical protein
MTTGAGDVVSQWAKLLPGGTYLTFKTFSAAMSNSGKCGISEKLIDGLAIFMFAVGCGFLTFTDSYVAENGKLYYGVVTPWGLWNPSFLDSGLQGVTGSTYVGGGTTYILKKRDFVNAVLAVLSFATLSLLSPMTTDCLYGGSTSGELRKVGPILVSLVVLFIWAFSPPGRNGIGHGVNSTNS